MNRTVSDGVEKGSQIGEVIQQEVFRAFAALQSADQISQMLGKLTNCIEYLNNIQIAIGVSGESSMESYLDHSLKRLKTIPAAPNVRMEVQASGDIELY